MLTIISGTNRPGSNTLKIARYYASALTGLGVENQLLTLEELPADFLRTDLYGKRSPVFQGLLDQYMIPVQKFAVFVPEYNGSFPGVFKLFIDAVQPEHFRGKKMGLIGVSAGRAGNLRGLDDLTNAFHYLKMNVYHHKIPVSQVRNLVSADELTDAATQKLLGEHAAAFSDY
ncbi:MAG: NADPH-dependent FMN reductase [Bacteroidetes bacterium]|nr:MAG: NADPH-dependent FMN reductase [Bacteroidota bacterium]